MSSSPPEAPQPPTIVLTSPGSARGGEPSDGLSATERYRHHVISSLHRWNHPDPAQHWEPHPSQLLVLEALFVHDCKLIFCQCGRKWGKTETIIYSLWRWALLNPGSSCYYICPELKQAKEIVWKSRDKQGKLRIQEFGPTEFIDAIDNTELRVTFKNGSFIKVDGSDNFDAWAGISPHFVILDEFRSFKPEFYSVMNPNRATFDAPMVIIGTPPKQIWLSKDVPHQYVEVAQEARTSMLENGESFHIKRPSWDNPDPVIQKFLAREKRILRKKNKLSEWWREYGAELVQDGENKVFPQFISDPTIQGTHVKTYSSIVDMMYFQ